MARKRIGKAINLILIGVVCGAFGALGTYAIYDIYHRNTLLNISDVLARSSRVELSQHRSKT